VTGRHYAPWVQKRQQQLEADLRSMWANDQTGTNQVQEINAPRVGFEPDTANQKTQLAYFNSIIKALEPLATLESGTKGYKT